MKLEEASVFVVHMYKSFNLTGKEKLALDEAFKCLQKGIAKKPIVRGAYLKCPTCNRQLAWSNPPRRKHKHNEYCTGCGQLIDWEGV